MVHFWQVIKLLVNHSKIVKGVQFTFKSQMSEFLSNVWSNLRKFRPTLMVNISGIQPPQQKLDPPFKSLFSQL